MVRRVFPMAAACLLVLTGWSPAVAQSVAGRWVLTVTLDAGSGDATFVFQQQGDSLTGTYSGVLGEQKVTGRVSNGVVEFSFESQAGTVVYRGKVVGDTMEGTCAYGQLGQGTFKGRRVAG